MKSQNYQNHVRYYPPHHFIFYPALVLFTGFSIFHACVGPEPRLAFAFVTVGFLFLGALSLLLRQHYALGNQNRIVRLEMRLRYYQLTGTRLETFENQLSFSQIAALRFASDEELPDLLQRAVTGNLSADDIKRSIKNWVPDVMRV